jgi:multicomponent Na+:H+ antiporter subunit B
MNSIILMAGTRILVALLLVFSVFMLLRGHNEPGGGFIGGLIAATGFVLFAIASGTEDARRALRVDPGVLAMVGLGVSLCAGLMPLAFGRGFFAAEWLFYIGASETEKGFPVSSVLLFDVGVYCVVMGAILMLVFALEEEV